MHGKRDSRDRQNKRLHTIRLVEEQIIHTDHCPRSNQHITALTNYNPTQQLQSEQQKSI